VKSLITIALGTAFALAATQAPAADVPIGATGAGGDLDSVTDACDWVLPGKPLQERSREVIRGISCHSLRWFDSLFGSEQDFDENAVSGELRLGLTYSQYEGFKPRLHFNVRAPLPNLSSRWDVLVGRVDAETYVTDTRNERSEFYNPGLIKRDDDAKWLLGLGKSNAGDPNGWDYAAGVHIDLPLDPFIRTRYYYARTFGTDDELSFRQTFFWRNNEGLGTTSRVGLEFSLAPRDVMRWEGVATVSQESDGVDWYAGNTWYHLLRDNKAFSVLAFVRGETTAEVPLKEYGFIFSWRQPLSRDWIYLSFGPSLTWPREHRYEQREASLGFIVWLDMTFGQWRY
jgi:hypothetical protein